MGSTIWLAIFGAATLMVGAVGGQFLLGSWVGRQLRRARGEE